MTVLLETEKSTDQLGMMTKIHSDFDQPWSGGECSPTQDIFSTEDLGYLGCGVNMEIQATLLNGDVAFSNKN